MNEKEKPVDPMEELTAQARCVNREGRGSLLHIFRNSNTVDIELNHALIAFAAIVTGRPFEKVKIGDLLAYVKVMKR